MTKEDEVAEMMTHLQSLNMNNEETQRLAKVLKDDEFKKLFVEYVNEISDPQNKEAMEKHINECENNQTHGTKKNSMEDKDLLIPYPDFCIKTYNTKTSQKVFINICYCEKVGNCVPFDDPIRKGTEWKIPYSLGGPAQEKDKANKKCLVYDYIVGTETHNETIGNKKFKHFLISTALEAIEKMKNVELDRKISLPLIKYKGKNGSKEPRIFTVNKLSSSKDTRQLSKANDCAKTNDKKIKEKTKVPTPTKEHKHTSQVENGKEPFDNARWEKEIAPPYEVLYSNTTTDYTNCWNDSQLVASKNVPKAIILRITLNDVVNLHDIVLDVEEKHVILRVPEKYRLKVDLRYIINKLQSHAQWKKHIHQLVVTLPIESTNVAN